MNKSEFDDAYEDKQRIRGAIFETSISELTFKPAVLIDIAATVGDAIKAMQEHRTGCVLVQRNGELAGMFTERDVIRQKLVRDESAAIKVESVMTRNPETLEAVDVIAFALNKMSVGGYRHIPIVDDSGKPMGVLSVRDLVDFLAELFPQDILNINPSPGKGISRSADGG